jgi:non-ribosomal peptide synthetase component F
MALMAPFAAVLFRHTGQEKVVVGSLTANRTRREVEGVIGFFVNLLPLPVDLAGDPALVDVLRRVRATAMEAYTHQELPFDRLVEELQPPRIPGVPPLVQAIFTFDAPGGGEPEIAGLDVRPLGGVGDDTVRFDLSMTVSQGSDGVGASLAYNVALFDEATAARLLADFVAMAEALAATPAARVLDVPLSLGAGPAPAAEPPAEDAAEFDFEALGA